MQWNKMALVTVAMIVVTFGVSGAQAKKAETNRINFDGDGFSLILPVDWATKRQDMPLFSLHTCVKLDDSPTPSPTATISLMFGRKEEGHEDFVSSVLKSISNTKISDRGKVTAKKKKGTLAGEWVQFNQVTDGVDGTIRVYFIKDTTQVFIIICQSKAAEFGAYAPLFSQVGESLIIE